MTADARVLANRYRLEAILGQGGMAIVYRAEDTALGRPVAVKILREQYGEDPEFLERFRREARAAASLSHPNIITVYDVGREGATNFIVMEWVDGEDLKDLLKREAPLSPPRLVEFGCQLAAALEYAHRRGLVHRDIKPQNVLVTRDGNLKVGDFGIAVALGARSITQTGMVIGSAHYMAPEQVQGKPGAPTTDIYALGVVLYEMATGRLPFEGESQLATAQMHLERQPTSPQQLNPRLPGPLSDVILQALAKDPAERLQSGAEVAAALRGQRSRADQRTVAVARSEVLAEEPGIARTRRLPPQRTTPATAVAPRQAAAPAPRPRKRGPGLGLFVPLALLLGGLAAGAGWFLGRPFGASAPTPTAVPVVVGSPNPTATSPPAKPTQTPAPTSAATATPVPPTPAPPTSTAVPPTATSAPPTATSAPPTPTAAPPTATAAPPTPPPAPPPQPTAPPKPAGTATSGRPQVPAVTGLREAEARSRIEAAGFRVEVAEQRGAEATHGIVVGQDPTPGTPLERGRTVQITVGRPQTAPQPTPAAKPKPKQEGHLRAVEGTNGMDARQALESGDRTGTGYGDRLPQHHMLAHVVGGDTDVALDGERGEAARQLQDGSLRARRRLSANLNDQSTDRAPFRPVAQPAAWQQRGRE